MGLEILANTQKYICGITDILYLFPPNSNVITHISMLIFNQNISKYCVISLLISMLVINQQTMILEEMYEK
jgi:hypothetical protein